MASTIATLQGELAARLKLGSTAGVPSSTNQSAYLRAAFRHVIGLLPPVTQATAALQLDTDGRLWIDLASTPADDVYHVTAYERALIMGTEWNRMGATLLFARTVGQAGDQLAYYYLPTITIVTASTTTVETSCIFGQNWLEEPALLYAEMTALSEYARVAASNSGPSHSQHYRSLEETYNQQIAARKERWNARMTEFANAESMRLQLGDVPLFRHRLSRLDVRGNRRVRNRMFPMSGAR